MKRLILLMFFGILPLSTFAATITIFNTGVDGSGNPLASGTVDPHYTSTGTVFAETTNGAWFSPGTVARYVSPDAPSQGNGVYTVDYTTTIDLTGFDPASVSISGGWSTDNFGNNIFVNGNAAGFTSTGFGSLISFTLTGASGFFHGGVNTIDFQWGNSGGPGGLLVEFTSATANAAAGGAPEPGSFVLLAAGVASLALARRRR